MFLCRWAGEILVAMEILPGKLQIWTEWLQKECYLRISTQPVQSVRLVGLIQLITYWCEKITFLNYLYVIYYIHCSHKGSVSQC
jgi:hypothetical protein